MQHTLFPTGIEKHILCARLYERIKIFYENPENQRRFKEWQTRRQNSNDLRTTKSQRA